MYNMLTNYVQTVAKLKTPCYNATKKHGKGIGIKDAFTIRDLIRTPVQCPEEREERR